MQIKALIGTWVLGAAAVSVASLASAADTCGADGTTKFICGLSSPEDLIHVPDSRWVMVSGMAEGGHRGQLYAIDQALTALATLARVLEDPAPEGSGRKR